MKRRFTVETTENEDKTIQTITYKNRKVWFDYQLAINRLRVEIELKMKLDLPMLYTQREENVYRTVYDGTSEDSHRFDGNYFVNYREPRKLCPTCMSYRDGVNYCSWKGEELIRPVKRCDGYLENTCLTNNLQNREPPEH